MTTAELAVKKALYKLWFKKYTKPISTEKRIELVEKFTEEWLDSDKIKVDKAFIYHPMNLLKRRYDEPAITVAEVLADFIMRVDIVAERDEDYPILNAEGELTRADQRAEHETGLYSDDVDAEAGERVPYGVITEAEAIAQLYTPREPATVEQFTAELARVKKYAEFYATSLAEEYGYKKCDVLQKIKGLRLERVKKCKICGGGFYPKNIRREVCDQQVGIIAGGARTAESACELEYNRNYHLEYYKNVTKTG